MKPKSLKQMAVMSVDKGEEIIGGWASAHIPQVGIYKLLAKKRVDGVIEWAHFVQRDSGLKEKVYRGEVESREQLDEVLEVMNKHLLRVFGTSMKAADYDMYTLNGKNIPATKH
jgi:oligoribonuclease (3'-5' exoribonuclease)